MRSIARMRMRSFARMRVWSSARKRVCPDRSGSSGARASVSTGPSPVAGPRPAVARGQQAPIAPFARGPPGWVRAKDLPAPMDSSRRFCRYYAMRQSDGPAGGAGPAGGFRGGAAGERDAFPADGASGGPGDPGTGPRGGASANAGAARQWQTGSQRSIGGAARQWHAGAQRGGGGWRYARRSASGSGSSADSKHSCMAMRAALVGQGFVHSDSLATRAESSARPPMARRPRNADGGAVCSAPAPCRWAGLACVARRARGG